ncbi:conjugal transfer protein TraB [Escherichia coli]|nr:conjugal transfer protein TraB [Escherichia coli]
MASINTIVKRKQYLWLGIVVVGAASAIGGALYLSDVDMSGNGETVAEQEPVPDMTGVVDTTFDDKVRQHATTEMQVTAAQMQKQYEEIRRELDVLNKQRGDDQRRIEKLGQDNAALAEQVKALGANPVTATGEPVPQTPASPPGPEGEPQPGNTPVSFPPQGSVAVPPPTAFYPGNGVTPPPQVTYQSVPVPNRIQRKVFTRNEGKQGPSLPYIPSGSFAKAMLIEGADANASVTGNESTMPMQLRITGLVEMPNSKTYDATGCFVGLEAWGDVSSERAIVRTRNISCLKDGKTIDMPIKGHVSFRGKNGIKGEVVMRNGKILGWAWGAGFVDGIGQGMERASQPAVGLGATAAYGAGDVLKMGIGGGASKAAQTLSDYYIKRAEQYHPVIPIGAGNEVTVVFQDGFQLKTVEEMVLERTQNRAEEDNPESPVPVPPSAESHLNGFNTDQMLKQLGNALKSQITKLLASIQNKAVSDTPLDDKEKGFISSTTIPVFKYLVDPQMLGVSNSMIYQLTDYIGYDILLQYIQELIQQARAMVATGNYDEAVIEHINDNMNDATRQIAAFQSQVQVQQDALLVVDRQMSYMRQQLSARMLSRYQNNYHFGGSTL